MTAAPRLNLRREAFRLLRPSRRRTFLEFAEREIVIPDGPRAGTRFRTDFMPFTRLVLEVYENSPYRRFFLSGPTQSGKTMLGYIIPTMYHACEIGENVILGAPTAHIAKEIFHDRLRPSIEASRYAELLPTSGAGARGGRGGLSIKLRNGAILRFMGAGGGDHQRSSFPSRVVVMTEMDKMDTPGKASRETGPTAQMEARTSSFSDRARTYGECTMSVEKGSINHEIMDVGTGSTLHFACPGCSRPFPLEREHFQGWQSAIDQDAAREGAHFVCPGCGKPWSERDHQAALKQPIILAKTQSIDPEGRIVGDLPRTNTFGLRWTAGASGFLEQADLGEKEYKAEQGSDEAKKELLQFVWARPYTGELLDFKRLEAEQVLRKITNHTRGAAPDGSVKTTLFIDVGSWFCWWVLMAWRPDASGHVMDFGRINCNQNRGDGHDPLLVLQALRGFREDKIKPGWLFGGRPDLILIDSGYEHEMVYQFVQESGQNPYFASKGFGTTKERRWHAPRIASSGLQIGNEWSVSLQASGIQLVEINADYWKTVVHDGFSAPAGKPGALSLFNWPAASEDMKTFARQVTAERRHVEQPLGKEPIVHWIVENKANHYLDCVAGNRVAADMLGIRLAPPPPPAAEDKPGRGPSGGWLKGKY